MKRDEALAVILYLQNRPQTDMTVGLRDLLARAWMDVGDIARIVIAREKADPVTQYPEVSSCPANKVLPS